MPVIRINIGCWRCSRSSNRSWFFKKTQLSHLRAPTIAVIRLYSQKESDSLDFLLDRPFLPLPATSPIVLIHAVNDMLSLLLVYSDKPPRSGVTVWKIVCRFERVVRKRNWLTDNVNIDGDTSATFCIPLARVKLVVGLLSFVKKEVYFFTTVASSSRRDTQAIVFNCTWTSWVRSLRPCPNSSIVLAIRKLLTYKLLLLFDHPA